MSHPLHSRDPARQGVALVLALVILTALLGLALPFVFSMSSSLRGAKVFSAKTQVTTARDSAVELAIGAADVAARVSLADTANPPRNASAMDLDINEAWGTTVAGIPSERYPYHIALQADSLGLELNQPPDLPIPAPQVSVLIEDEYAKLDPNTLDATGWGQLLAAAGIDDWDDDSVPDSQDLNGDDPTGDADTPPDGDDDDDGGGTDFNDDGDDGNAIGELAEALSNLRFSLSDDRITSLDQLLLANPGHNNDDNSGGSVYQYATTNTPVTGSFGFRHPLTRAELALLRPYLSVHTLGQGREGGHIDLGTTIWKDGTTPVLDIPGGALAPTTGDQGPQIRRSLTATGTVYRVLEPSGAAVGSYRSGGGGSTSRSNLQEDGVWQAETPAPVNIHAIPGTVAAIVGNGTQPDFTSGSGAFPRLSVTDVDGLFSDAIGRLAPAGGNRETAPLSLRSLGAVTIDAAATAYDPAGRPLAHAARRQIVQALPAEPLRFVWDTQAELESLRRSRFTSRLTSWPQPVDRLTDLNDSDMDDDPATSDRGLGFAPLTTLAGLSTSDRRYPARQWRAPLRSDAADVWNPRAGGASSTAWPTTTVTPDGLDVSGGAVRYPTTTSAGPVRTVSTNETAGTTLALWIKPNVTPTTEVVLCELRAESGNAFPQLDGTAGDRDQQNLWQLVYTGEFLILRLANAAIERTNAATDSAGGIIEAPEDDVTDATLFFNEQSLGSEASDAEPLAPAQPWTRVAFYWHCPGGLPTHRWTHLQVVVAHDRPGGQAILVDGLPGRNLSMEPTGTTAQYGDHILLPSVLLDEALPGNAVTSGSQLTLPTLRLAVTSLHTMLGISVSDLLPARGMVLIGDEYLSYAGITGSSLTGVYRAIRANTNTNSGTQSERWPTLQAHAQGDLVSPGGFRYRTGSNLFTGATASADRLGNGDDRQTLPDPSSGGGTLNPNPYQWRSWGRASVDQADYPTTHKVDSDGDGIFSLAIDEDLDSGLRLQPSPQGFFDDFPAEDGLIRIGNQYFVYDTFSATGTPTITGLTAVTPIESTATFSSAPQDFNSAPDTDAEANAPVIILVGLRTTTTDLITPVGNFRITGGRGSQQIELTDPTTGRVEWIAYDDILIHDDGAGGTGYFVNQDGFPRADSRGTQRTIFAGDYTGAVAVADLPATSQILPVQTDFGSSHTLATGDVVTLMPDNASSVDAQQMVIRLAATDGYVHTSAPPAPTTGVSEDTRNEFFTFTTQVPADFASGSTFEMLSGLCWSGRDLSSLNPANNQAKGLMPRMDLMGTGRTANNVTADWFARADNSLAISATVDALWAGGLDGSPIGGSSLARIIALDGSDVGSATASDTGFEIQIDTPVFEDDGIDTGSNANREDRHGLLLIGDEVVAYQRNNDEAPPNDGTNGFLATVVARGLLGTTPRPITLTRTETSDGNLRATDGPQVIRLPVGPVWMVNGTLPVDHQGPITLTSNSMDAADVPALLSVELGSGSPRYELIHAVIRSDDFITAPWLRGAYGTTPIELASGDLLIGWWPRYPSAMPEASGPAWGGLSTTDRSAMIRSRFYPWASAPSRLHDTLMVDALTLGHDTPSTLDLRVRALADGIGWGAAIDEGVNGDAAAAIADNSIWDRYVDGAEVRWFWRYTDTLAPDASDFFRELAEHSNQSARIEGIEVQAMAPTRLLEVESGR